MILETKRELCECFCVSVFLRFIRDRLTVVETNLRAWFVSGEGYSYEYLLCSKRILKRQLYRFAALHPSERSGLCTANFKAMPLHLFVSTQCSSHAPSLNHSGSRLIFCSIGQIARSGNSKYRSLERAWPGVLYYWTKYIRAFLHICILPIKRCSLAHLQKASEASRRPLVLPSITSGTWRNEYFAGVRAIR